MTTEADSFCLKHTHLDDRFPVWPDSAGMPEIIEVEGVKVYAFCDSNDAFGYAFIQITDCSYVLAFLHENEDDKTGKERTISKREPIFFYGEKWLRIVSSKDNAEIHLRHRREGDFHSSELKFTKLVPDPDLSLS